LSVRPTPPSLSPATSWVWILHRVYSVCAVSSPSSSSRCGLVPPLFLGKPSLLKSSRYLTAVMCRDPAVRETGLSQRCGTAG
jgi:hypothetical protein